MNIPSDYPSPDQENVYYSVPSLKNKLSEYFDGAIVVDIISRYSEHRLPVFILDDSNTPEKYTITVYSEGKSPVTKTINSAGGIVTSVEVKLPEASSVESKIIDDASSIVLDSSYHSTNTIRDNSFKLELVPDQEQLLTKEDDAYALELILSTKYHHDNSLIQERGRFLSIIKNIVADGIRNLTPLEYETITAEYQNVNKEIDSIISFISGIKEGKKDSVDSINFSKPKTEIFGEPRYDGEGIQTTRLQFSQGYSYLANIKTQKSGIISLPDSLPPKDSRKLLPGKLFDDVYQSAWTKSLDSLIENGFLKEVIPNVPLGSSIDTILGELGDLLRFSFNSITKETLSTSGWIGEWYVSNLLKKVNSEDPDFESLDAYLKLHADSVSNLQKYAELRALKGNGLVVRQAVLKAIADLCQSNLDVTEHVPRMESGESIFDLCSRSSILGPSMTHPWPAKTSKRVSDENRERIQNYSKTGFLCYAPLIKISNKLFSNDTAKQYIFENIKQYNSDHDRVLQLWETITELDLDSSTSKPKDGTSTYSVEYRTSDKSVYHLYKLGEKFDNSTMFVIPRGDSTAGANIRSFINWNIQPVEGSIPHYVRNRQAKKTKEQGFGDFDIQEVTQSNPKNLVITDAKSLQTQMLRMGWKYNKSTHKRERRVHYSIVDKSKWSKEDLKNGDVFEWFLNWKGGGAPMLWASVVSLYKAIYIETCRNMLDSISSITEEDISLEYEDFEKIFPMEEIFKAMETVLLNLSEISKSNVATFVDGTGALCIGELNNDDDTKNALRKIGDSEYRNTTGNIAIPLLKDYANFISLISPSNNVSVVDEQEDVELDYKSYLPPESFQVNGNPNFGLFHGGNINFIQPEFKSYKDKLQFLPEEFKSRRLINKRSLPTTDRYELDDPYQLYLERFSYLYLYSSFLDFTSEKLQKFKSFLEGMTVSETAADIFTEGHFDPVEGLANPRKTLSQIISQRQMLAADFDGVSKRYKNMKLDNSRLKKYQNHYIYVVGLDENAWESETSTVKLYAEFVDTNQALETSFEFTYTKPNSSEEAQTSSEIASREILDYLHLCRGISLTESTFSDKTELLYSKTLQDNTADIFPWSSDDFEENYAKNNLESIWNISPMLFSRNYFFDVCGNNKYHRVVGVYVSPDDLRSLGFEDELIGSIRWRIGEKDA